MVKVYGIVRTDLDTKESAIVDWTKNAIYAEIACETFQRLDVLYKHGNYQYTYVIRDRYKDDDFLLWAKNFPECYNLAFS